MIITISREYGAGGHSIGKSVAKELGVEFYDRDIIRATVKESGVETPEVERVEEELTRSQIFWRAISPNGYIDLQDNIRAIEKSVMLELAAKGSCVILGRCADVILAQAGIPSLNVFLYADDVHRAVRVSQLIDSKNPNEIQKAMKKHDLARQTFYEQFTGQRWGDSRNYNLSLDTGFLGYDACVKMICDAARGAEALQA